jgi:bifunctional N-acetylglucosamine-1-phosphate-uridyltransferase/glucosamine-1-phosphate-acetyltransferase GlmU-like protein
MSSSPISVVILAAGLGTRMRSRLAKEHACSST